MPWLLNLISSNKHFLIEKCYLIGKSFMVVTEEEVFYQAQTCRFFMFCICLNGCEQTKMFSSKSKKDHFFFIHIFLSLFVMKCNSCFLFTTGWTMKNRNKRMLLHPFCIYISNLKKTKLLHLHANCVKTRCNIFA